jgi:tetratricopeptide (TPR) repeat protein
VADGLTAYLNGVQDRLKTVERERAVAEAKAVAERRRRRVLVVAATLVLMLLIAGISGTTIGLLQAQEKRKLADERYELLQEEHRKTEIEHSRTIANYGTARELVQDIGQRINQIETGISDPKVADLARKQALDKAREQFDKWRSDNPDDAIVHRQAAYLHRYAANVARSLSDFPEAMKAYSAAIRIFEDLMSRFPDIQNYRDDLAQTLSDRAVAEKKMGHLKDASVTLERAWSITEGIQADHRDLPTVRRSIAIILNDRTDVAYRLGLFDEAARLAGQAHEIFDQLKTVPPHQRNPVDPLYAAMTIHRLALSRREFGKTAEALTAHEDAVARMKALTGPKANRDALYWDCEVRRELALTAGQIPSRRQAAVDDLVEVIRVMEKLVAENPLIVFYREGLAAAYLLRGELLLLDSKPELATAALEKSMAVSRELLDRFGALTGSVLVRGQASLALGRARAAVGKNDEAVVDWKRAVAVFEIGVKNDPDNYFHQRGLTASRKLLGKPTK